MNEHYFSTDPVVADEPRTVTFTLEGREYVLASTSGVFSGDRLDPGTRVLLRKAPLPTGAATVLDVGCGYGPIACVLASQSANVSVWAVDINTRALELTDVNARALGVGERVRARTPDDVPDDQRFDQIWSNPPIRIGKSGLHELLSRWLPRLTEGGVAWLVVARNLGSDSLQRWLFEQGWRCARHASAKGYRVLAVRRC